MIKSIFVLLALTFSFSVFAADNSSNVESYINQLMSSQAFADLQGQSCISKEAVRDLLRAQMGQTVLGCQPEGARCSENSQCCQNRCTGIRCDDTAGR